MTTSSTNTINWSVLVKMFVAKAVPWLTAEISSGQDDFFAKLFSSPDMKHFAVAVLGIVAAAVAGWGTRKGDLAANKPANDEGM